jgi:hypothetical protein
MRRVVLAAVAICALTAAPHAGASASCVVRGDAIAGVARSHVLAEQGPLVAYRVRGASADTWWACRTGFPGSPVKLGTDESYQDGASEYGPAVTLGRLHLSIGGFVFFYRVSNLESYAQCTKYYQYPCSGPTGSLLAVSLPERRIGAVDRFVTDSLDASGADSSTKLTRVVVGTDGLVAWLLHRQAATAAGPQPPVDTLDGCTVTVRAGTPGCVTQVLASGTIPPASLALHVDTVTFTENGTSQVAVVP